MKTFFKEFKEFISRGSVMDMAVGIIIGGAFTAIINSLVDDIINPLLGIFGGMNFDQLSVNLGGEATLFYGKFITAVINFLIMALIVFLIIRGLNRTKALAEKVRKKEEAEEEATEKDCPYCMSKIPVKATKCMYCTSEVE